MRQVIVLISILGALCQANPFTRMWHGQRAEIVPHHVHIWIYDSEYFIWPASGVLLTSKHVLTAAINIHHYYRWDMGFGSNLQKSLTMIRSEEAYIHENFDNQTDDNNLGFIISPEAIIFTDKISPIRLPKQGEVIPNEFEVGSIAAFSYIMDHGPISTRLEGGRQSVVSTTECEKQYPHLVGMVHHYFCAYDADFNVCGGAQGAGLSVQRNGQNILAGILSFGSIWEGCGSHTPPGFIKISEYVDWIEGKIHA